MESILNKSLSCAPNQNVRAAGRPKATASILSECYKSWKKPKSETSAEKFSKNFNYDKGNQFIRNYIMKEWLKKHEKDPLVDSAFLATLLDLKKNKMIMSARRTDQSRKILQANPGESNAIISSFKRQENWGSKLCKCLKIDFASEMDLEQKSLCNERLIRMINAHISDDITEDFVAAAKNEEAECEMPWEQSILEELDNIPSDQSTCVTLTEQSNFYQSYQNCYTSESDSFDNPNTGVLVGNTRNILVYSVESERKQPLAPHCSYCKNYPDRNR